MQRSSNYSWQPAPWRWVLFDPLNALKSRTYVKQLRNFTPKSSFTDSLGNVSILLLAFGLSCEGDDLFSLAVIFSSLCLLHGSQLRLCIPCLVPAGISFCGHHICISQKHMVFGYSVNNPNNRSTNGQQLKSQNRQEEVELSRTRHTSNKTQHM